MENPFPVANITTVERPKNVPEELRIFLENHPDEWFTNEQLAERLNHTPSGIRNAVTKLKATSLIKTHMNGSLAYRAWHSASEETFPFHLPESQKKIASRKCNGCGTQNSRYWRSDLEEKNGWLCNNCGMNQRRGRGVHRLNSGGAGPSSQLSQDDYIPISLDDIAPSAEPVELEKQFIEVSKEDDLEDTMDLNYYPSVVAIQPVKRKPPHPSYVDPSKRKCGHCHTTKSAGKWRRDREVPDRYLCNKCGMNQRRTQMRLEQQQQLLLKQKQQLQNAASAHHFETTIYTRAGRLGKMLPCNLCQEKLPTFIADCSHRMCGECVPGLIHTLDEMVSCPICPKNASLIPMYLLGKFVDNLLMDQD